MSKEAMDTCICGLKVAFQEYHWPHCPMNPANLTKSERQHMERKFTKAELAHIGRMGKSA
jgi:hypothetical protein